ncbi:hypothetical protein FZI93_30760 [Mycobacterium sp. CBMA361]|nr:hypothetical protein [Mycolicibacterium sp. CBMA 361]
MGTNSWWSAAKPLAAAGLTSAAFAGAGVMLLLGPDSPTMQSVTADIKLVNTESSTSDGGSKPGSSGASKATDGNAKSQGKPQSPAKPKPGQTQDSGTTTDTPRTSRQQAQDRMRQYADDARKALTNAGPRTKPKHTGTPDGSSGAASGETTTDTPATRPSRGTRSTAAPKPGAAGNANSTAAVGPNRTRTGVVGGSSTAGNQAAATPTAPSGQSTPSAPASPGTVPAVTAATSKPFNPITGMLSAIGLGTMLVPNAPTTPGQMPDVWAVMAWVRRQVEYGATKRVQLGHPTSLAATSPPSIRWLPSIPWPASPSSTRLSWSPAGSTGTCTTACKAGSPARSALWSTEWSTCLLGNT